MEQNYLVHSKKGTSWTKAGAKYISRIKKNGKWVYTYKLRKNKEAVEKAATKFKEDREMNKRIEEQKVRDKKTKELRSKKYQVSNKIGGYVKTYKIRKHEKDMKKYSDSQVKKHKEMLHAMSNGYSYLIHSENESPAKSENYLIHSKGPWKDHKYTAKKMGSNGKPIYIYSEYKEGDKDFDYEGEEWEKNFKRVGDTDGFVKTNPDGTITIVEEDMKWTLPKGTKVNDDLVNKLLDGWKNDSRKYRAKEYQKETAQNNQREQTARTISRSNYEQQKRGHAMAKAYEEQKNQQERYQNALDDVARAYNDQKKKKK